MSELHKFLFEGMPVRGLLVRLTDGWQEVLRRREVSNDTFAAPVRSLLGEMAAAATLMQANLQFNGSLILQVFGDGPVKLAVAQAQPDLAFRVTAKVTGPVQPQDRLEALLNVGGGGRCTITLDPKDRHPGQQPYQSVVPLHGDAREPLQRLSEVLEHFMLQSEQLDTRLVLAADDRVAAGLLIQRLPTQGAGNLAGRLHSAENLDQIGADEDYNRIAHLAATLTPQELLSLDADTLLRRLFWEEALRRFPVQAGAQGPRFACRCSREHVGHMLRGLGREEVDGIVAEQGRAEIGCDFCGLKYHFDSVDVGGLFTPLSEHLPGSSALN